MSYKRDLGRSKAAENGDDWEDVSNTVEGKQLLSQEYVAPTQVGMGQASVFSCVVNLSNTIVGAGILGLPRAYSESGWFVGTLMLIMAGLSSGLSLHLLAVSEATVGIRPSSFYTVAKASIPSFVKLIDVAVVLKCFGVGTSYLIVIGDLMPDVMDHLGGPTSRTLWVSVAFFMVMPLAFLKTLDALKVTSTLALICVSMVAGIILLFAFGIDGLSIPCDALESLDNVSQSYDITTCPAPELYPRTSFVRTIKVATIYTFSYTCQQNIFSVCSEIKNGTIKRVDNVIRVAIFGTMALYLMVAIAGFITFGANVEADVLNSYPHTSLVTVARIAIVLLVTFSYPLQAHPARRCALTVYSATVLGDDQDGKPRQPGLFAFYSASALFAFGSYAIALVLDDLGIVLELVGATGSTMVSYILPGAIYWHLHPHGGWLRIAAAMQFCIGCVIIPVALFFDLEIGAKIASMVAEEEVIAAG